MINLTEKYYISEGGTRKCYAHPTDKNLCIKILHQSTAQHTDFMHKEIKYYNKIQNKNKKYSLDFYAKYHGMVETNLGIGYLYDLIRNEDKSISLPLKYYITTKQNQLSDDVIDIAIGNLKQKMIKYKIMGSDLEAHNILCRLTGNNCLDLVIIDGIGHRDFIPLADFFDFFAKKKVDRKMHSLSRLRMHYKE